MRIKNKVKYVLSLFLCMVCIIAVPALANDDTQRVFDYADLLTDTEEAELNQACIGAEDALETELYILTTNDTGGKETVDYADDFGDEHAFGYDEPYGNYMILCIDMDNRIVWLSTSGKAETYFTEARIDALLDDLYGYLTAGDYYNTCLSYLESSEKYLTKPPVYNDTTTNPDNYQDTMYVYDEEKTILSYWYFRLAIAAAAAGIVVAIMSCQAKTNMTVNERTYSKNGLKINNRMDNFIRRTTTSRRIESSSSGSSRSSGGGGGHHTSSGGHSHGGGGRSF